MTYEGDPSRMLEGASGPLRAALDAARGDGPTLAQLQALRASVSAAAGAGASLSASAAGAGAKSAGLSLFAKAGLAAVVAGAVAGGSLVASGRLSPPSSARFAPAAAPREPTRTIEVSAAALAVSEAPAARVAHGEPAARVPPEASEPRVEAPARALVRAPARAATTVDAPTVLAARPSAVSEAPRVDDGAAVGEAQTALRTGRYELALEISERLAGEEREAVAIQALAGLGRSADAASRAARFFASSPTSIYRRRIEFVLARAAAP